MIAPILLLTITVASITIARCSKGAGQRLLRRLPADPQRGFQQEPIILVFVAQLRPFKCYS